ncbi:hypothetical protein Q0Z83_046300 [Actinoplanes sichuanensis]|uniref:Maleylpyruvate isomerase N-terminal domain-containing protein n=1 Tax=Actinoplanes sichuanensis TaxID=512349 RepID=A0ABW4AAV9_9ACTN|nr:maleylpyruvate isomerase N-terminal domain-containing protein [Actinoplanes sichuanensis]BEL06439.1 hypothetical protein Q0Z83_046300 [Actinoplanes sichuanensis]
MSDVFTAEADAFAATLRELPPDAWAAPTRCVPWLVRDLVGHVITAVARTPVMIAAPAPERADTTATGYYRADERFSDASNAERVYTARQRAADAEGFAEVCRSAAALSAAQPAGRLVRTRHGDAMLLTDFLITRVVELALHGLDVADATGREPWLTTEASDLVLGLLFGPTWRKAVTDSGWPPELLLRRATGRAPVTDTEMRTLDRLGLRRLALG